MTVIRQSVFVVPEIVDIARRQGFFDQADLVVDDVMTPSSTAQVEDFQAGRIDVAITSIDNLLAWNTRVSARTAAGIVQIARIETTTDLALVTRPGLPRLTGAERLRLAVDAPSNGFAVVAYAMLARLGVAPADYEAVPLGGVRDRFEALLQGAADVTLVAPPLDALGVDRGMTVLSRVADLEPRYPGLGIVARRDRLAEDDALVRYLRALEQARPLMAAPPPDLRPPSDGFPVLTELRATVSMTVPGQPDVADLVVDATHIDLRTP
jgi:ABC-type nitrate/sulfonate/bicarbonate transport system substrate-binding protein